MSTFISSEELAKHHDATDCWVAIDGVVYDLTKFLAEHPGGAAVIIRLAGTDGSKAFAAIHSPLILDNAQQYRVGTTHQIKRKKTELVHVEHPNLPEVDSLLNVYEMEAAAKAVMSPDGWAYYSSGADDEVTLRENQNVFDRVFLRPRVMVDVSNISLECSILSTGSSLPLFISACAMGKMAHPNGEAVLTRAAHENGVIQMLPTFSSCSHDEIMDVKSPSQTLWFQLYVNPNRSITEELVKKVEKLGFKALVVTVDAPGMSRREKDMKLKFTQTLPSMATGSSTDSSKGVATALSSFIDRSVSWKDIAWLRSLTSMPIIIKGIQTVEDALLAADHEVAAIIISNHGGRQLDYAPPTLEILAEVSAALAHRSHKMELYVDGGIRRGSDIFKCLALGARAVGIGRPVLYGMAAYGVQGVNKVLCMLRGELINVMRQCGTPSVAHIHRSFVSLQSIAAHSPGAGRQLARDVYEPMTLPAKL